MGKGNKERFGAIRGEGRFTGLEETYLPITGVRGS